MKQLLKNELSGWKLWEVCWILIASAVIAGLSICWDDDLERFGTAKKLHLNLTTQW